MNWIIGFFCLAWVAVFTSQSAVDLADILITLGALVLAFRSKEVKTLFTQFKPAWLWPVWLAVMIVGLYINIGFAKEPWNEFLEFRWILTFLAIIYLGTKVVKSDVQFKLLVFLTLVLNAAAFVFFFIDVDPRAGGILRASMPFSHNMAPVFCLFTIYVLSQWKSLDGRMKFLISLVAISSGVLTVLTLTRGVWIGSFIGLAAALLFWNRKVFAYVMAAIVVVGGITLFSSKRINDRFFGKTNNETQSNSERIALWRGNWRMIQEYPVLGVGFGQNRNHLRGYYDEWGYPENQRVSHAHNQYLQVWAGTGTLGFICYLGFLFLIFKYAFEGYWKTLDPRKKSFQLGLIAALICFLVGSLTESNFNIAKNRLLFLLLAGWAVARALKARNESKP